MFLAALAFGADVVGQLPGVDIPCSHAHQVLPHLDPSAVDICMANTGCRRKARMGAKGSP